MKGPHFALLYTTLVFVLTCTDAASEDGDVWQSQDDVRKLASELEALKAHVQQRDNEITHLKATVSNLEKRLEETLELTKQQFPKAASPIAFTASLSHEFSSGSSAQAIPFDHIVLNHGECYDPDDFSFVAPTRGLYFFSVSMGPSSKGYVILTLNSEPISSACTHAHTGAWYTGDATSAMLFLEVGDAVWVTLEDGSLHTFYGTGGYRNTFTGFLYAEL